MTDPFFDRLAAVLFEEKKILAHLVPARAIMEHAFLRHKPHPLQKNP